MGYVKEDAIAPVIRSEDIGKLATALVAAQADVETALKALNSKRRTTGLTTRLISR